MIRVPPGAALGNATLGPLYRRLVFGVAGPNVARITSWQRSSAENRAVGGDPYSQHLIAFAIDAIAAGSRAVELERQARAAGLVIVDEIDHHHAQVLRAGTLRSIFFPAPVVFPLGPRI